MSVQYGGHIKVTVIVNGQPAVWEYWPSHAALGINSLMIHFQSTFNDDATPCQTTIDLFNLSPNSLNFIVKGAHVILEAGYGTDIGIITEGDIQYVYPSVNQGGGEIKTSFVFIEGVDGQKQASMKLSLAPGISAQDAINQIAAQSGVSVANIKLPKNMAYSDGYSVDGSPLDTITQIAKDAGAKVYQKHGRITINVIADNGNAPLVYDADHGLIGYPQPLSWSNTDPTTGFSVELLLNHRITVGTAIQLNSKYGGGAIYHFRNGQHSFDGTNFRTTGEII